MPEENEQWYDGLSDDLKGNEKITSFKSVEEMATAYTKVPEPVVLPEGKDGYQLPKDYAVTGLRTFAHTSKLTQDQLNGLIKFTTERQESLQKVMKETAKKNVDSLKKDWGEKYTDNVKVVERAIEHFDNDKGELSKYLNNTSVGKEPVIIKLMQSVGAILKEGGFLKSDGKPTQDAKSIAEMLYPNQGKA